MTARERILAIKLLEKQKRKPEYVERIGIQVSMIKKDPNIMEVKNVKESYGTFNLHDNGLVFCGSFCGKA